MTNSMAPRLDSAYVNRNGAGSHLPVLGSGCPSSLVFVLGDQMVQRPQAPEKGNKGQTRPEWRRLGVLGHSIY